MGLPELIREEAASLPESQAREVLDFIGYLKSRQEREQWAGMQLAQQTALASVWDNPEDEAWNDL